MKNSFLRKILENIKNGDYIIQFNMGDQENENYNYIKNLMESSKGVYAVSQKNEVFYEYFNKSKLALFFDSNKQCYFGWGILEENPSKKKYKEDNIDFVEAYPSCNYGPYVFTDNMKKNPLPEYSKYTKEEYKKYKQFYKFSQAGLLNYYVPKEELYNNLKAVENIKGVNGGRPAVKAIKVLNSNLLKEVLLTESVDPSKLGLPKIKHSLIQQVDYYGLENVHTAFLKNFIKPDNIYTENSEPLKRMINLLTTDMIPEYKNLDIKDIRNDSYEVISQHKYTRGVIPDMVLEGNKYRFIIEAKYKSEEGEDQTLKYYDYFTNKRENDTHKNIYVFLYLYSSVCEKLSADKKKEIYNKISYKKLINEIYLYNYKDIKHIDIISDYLLSFVHIPEGLTIDDVPVVEITKLNNTVLDLYLEKTINRFYQKLKEEKLLDSSIKRSIKFVDANKYYLAKYFIATLYNSNKAEKEKLKNLYTSIKLVSEK